MSRKPLLWVSCVVVISAVAAFGIHRWKANPAQSSSPVVTIAQAGDFYLYAPLYIAADNHYFSNRGLDVRIVSSGGDDKTWAAVISKDAQFGVADPTFVAVASARGQPGKVIATVVNGVPFWGITKNTAVPPTVSPEQLKGFTVVTFPSPSTAYTLQRQMFVRGNVTPSIRQAPFGSLLPIVESGEADIALELEPNVSQAETKGYRVVYSLADLYGDFTITGLACTPSFLSENGQTAKDVVAALQEALDFIHQHPDESAQLLAKRFPEVDREVAKRALKRVLAAGIIPVSAQVRDDAWRKALQLRIDAGDLTPTVDAMQFVDRSIATPR